MPANVIMPKLGWVMERGTITRWLKVEGETVKKGEPLFEVETEKTTVEVEAPASGVLRKVLAHEGSVVGVFKVVGLIADPDDSSQKTTQSDFEDAKDQSWSETGRGGTDPQGGCGGSPRLIKASPRARRLAKERRVDLSLVTHTGRAGYINEWDVRAFLEKGLGATSSAAHLATEVVSDVPAVKGNEFGGVDAAHFAQTMVTSARSLTPHVIRVIPMTGVRSIVARRMSESAHTAAHVTLTTEADATELVRLREQSKGGKSDTSYDSLLVKITAQALREFPNLNATLAGDEIQVLEDINIGVAVDTEQGLVVPVVRNADRKDVGQLEQNIRDLVHKARAGGLAPDDTVGGTFTVTNLGIHGIDTFTPLINPPQCAILGIGRIAAKPTVVGGEIRVQQRVPLSLSFDHRIVDGAPAARFLHRVRQLTEKPYGVLP